MVCTSKAARRRSASGRRCSAEPLPCHGELLHAWRCICAPVRDVRLSRLVSARTRLALRIWPNELTSIGRKPSAERVNAVGRFAAAHHAVQGRFGSAVLESSHGLGLKLTVTVVGFGVPHCRFTTGGTLPRAARRERSLSCFASLCSFYRFGEAWRTVRCLLFGAAPTARPHKGAARCRSRNGERVTTAAKTAGR